MNQVGASRGMAETDYDYDTVELQRKEDIWEVHYQCNYFTYT